MYKSLKQRQEEFANSLPTNDSQAVEDVKIYSSLSDDDLNKLPAFEPNGEVKFYPVGDSLLGKSALIQFIKQLKK